MRRLACLLLLAISCRSLSGPAFPPLRAATPEAALDELRKRVENFAGARSMMRVRVVGDTTRSFRAQLIIRDRERMELIVYSPVGTTAAVFRSEEGTPPPPEMKPFLENQKPAELAMLLLGLPAVGDATYEASERGLKRAVVGEAVITYDPPVFPPKHVTVRRGSEQLEVEHLELVRPE